jgi:hypothetical protein
MSNHEQKGKLTLNVLILPQYILHAANTYLVRAIIRFGATKSYLVTDVNLQVDGDIGNWFRRNLVRIRKVLWLAAFASVNRITEIYWSPSTICLRLNKINVRTTVFTNFHGSAL